ncbi:MAG: tRNA lysidine(34) synthetase TilS [Pirellulaceae bacterium]
MTGGLPERLASVWPPAEWAEASVLVGVSGGADSVALVRCLILLKQRAGGAGQLLVAHYNHRLRGAESDADQQFVQRLCGQLQVPCITNDPLGLEPGTGRDLDNASPFANSGTDVVEAAAPAAADEASARSARYRFLTARAKAAGARYLVVAHTADDQAETVLHRILRGTGLDGLAGIPRVRQLVPGVSLIRPLLDCWRHEVLEFLAQLGQPFRDDTSNASRQYTRNRLRHDLLPQLERTYNPQVRAALWRLAEQARAFHAFADAACAEWETRLVRVRQPERVVLDGAILAAMPPFLVIPALIRLWDVQGWPRGAMSGAHWQQLASLCAVAVGPTTHRRTLPGHLEVRAGAGRLCLLRATTSKPPHRPGPSTPR